MDSVTARQADLEIAKLCLLQDGKYWMSQIRMTELFSCRTSSICAMLSTFTQEELENEKIAFTISIQQGRQRVNKKVLHYGMAVVYNIAMRKRAVDLLPRIQTLMPPGSSIRIATLPERKFGLQLERILSGIVTVQRQKSFPPYMVDFYLPELHIAIEHDGDYHFDPAVQMSDLDREVELQNEYGLTVIRVPHIDEVAGINMILKAVFTSRLDKNRRAA